MSKKDFLSIRDYAPDEIRGIIDEAFAMKADPTQYARSLEGKTLALILEKPSLRTRVTFDVGIQQLGGFSLYLSPAEINLGKRESVKDVAKNLERMVQGIMVRTFDQEVVEELAAQASIPIINGLTDFNHPCQAMADYMTMIEIKKDLAGCKVAFVGDGNNVTHSLIYGAVRLGADLTVATPSNFQPDASVVAWAREHAGETGASVNLTADAAEAVTDADVVYTDVWTSMGQEAEAKERMAMFRPYQVNEELFAKAKPDAIFMHCLPAHRGEEVTDGVIDSPRSVVFQEAENRLHAQKSIMHRLMG